MAIQLSTVAPRRFLGQVALAAASSVSIAVLTLLAGVLAARLLGHGALVYHSARLAASPGG